MINSDLSTLVHSNITRDRGGLSREDGGGEGVTDEDTAKAAFISTVPLFGRVDETFLKSLTPFLT